MMRRRRTPRLACGSLYSPAESGPRWTSASRIRRITAARSRSTTPTTPAIPHIRWPAGGSSRQSSLDLVLKLLGRWLVRLDAKECVDLSQRVGELPIRDKSAHELDPDLNLVQRVGDPRDTKTSACDGIRRAAQPAEHLGLGQVDLGVIRLVQR